mmetsp:Transcript_70212/g.205876  ORF Transcript_70212/g.205876 Transcript_70212/m.205876 type:complete len:679 (+) Transcript_70212:70-2106(+)
MASGSSAMAAGGGTVWSTFSVPGVDGGSFWQMFGDGDFSGASPLDILLESPDCSIEALLDEEDVVQEFKARQSKLVARLCRPDAVLKLVEFITREPPDDASSSLCFAYPFVAMQLITCGVDELFEVWANPDNKEILEQFWSFLDATPASQVNPVLAGYFSRTAAVLFRRCPQAAASSLKARGDEAVFQQFVDRLHSRSIAELFARLVCAESELELVFPTEGLVSRLVSLLQHQGLCADTLENLAMVLRELFARKDTICFTDDLVRDASSRDSVDLLVTHALGDDPGRASAAMSMLFSSLYHTSSEEVQATFPVYAPLAPHPLRFDGEEMLTVGVSVNETDVCEALPARMGFDRPMRSLSGVSVNMPSLNGRLCDFICSHFEQVRAFLDRRIEMETPSPTPIRGGVSAVGSATLELIFLLALLTRSSRSAVLNAFEREQILPRCFKLLLRHPWSSLLHNAIGSLFSEILAISDEDSVMLVKGFTRPGSIIESVVAEYSAQERFDSGERQRQPRVGYMGQLHVLCCDLRDFCDNSHECGSAVASVRGWSSTVQPAVSATLRVFDQELGVQEGAMPPALARLRSPQEGEASSSAAGLGAAGDPGGGPSYEEPFILEVGDPWSDGAINGAGAAAAQATEAGASSAKGSPSPGLEAARRNAAGRVGPTKNGRTAGSGRCCVVA